MFFKEFSASIAALCAAGVIAIGSSAYAQSTTDTPAADAEAPETQQTDDTDSSEGTKIEDQLSLGEDADAPSDLGTPYAKEVNGAWELRCLKTAVPEEDPCQMYQLIDDGEGVPVAEFTVFRLPAGGQAIAGATVIVPLETALPPQLTINVDGAKPRRYPYAFCNQLGCYSRIGLTAADVAAFKAGSKAVLTIVPALAPDQKVELTVDLSGFTATFDKASVVEN